VPLVPPKVAKVQMPEEGSAGQIAQALLGKEVSVVSAFQNVAAHHLQEGKGIDCDVLVTGNNIEAREVVIGLVEAAGMRGFHAGPIANAAAAEALTSILIAINRRYKCHAGIQITGLEQV
jgi:NADPH-dependent F420 reductase